MAKPWVDLSIEFEGLDEFVDQFEDLYQLLDHNVEKALQKYALLVEEGAIALTFRDQGALEDSISATPIRKRSGIFINSVEAVAPYANRLHEQPYKPGTRPKYEKGTKEEGYYVDGRGRRTREKATWRGETPGRKFLTRAVDVTEKDWNDLMQKALEDTLRGRRG